MDKSISPEIMEVIEKATQRAHQEIGNKLVEEARTNVLSCLINHGIVDAIECEFIDRE